MGRQAYMTRLTLGRSAYELPAASESAQDEAAENNLVDPGNPSVYAQQYDYRGYPENQVSRAAARRSRRAQNDVLSTVGVCVGVDANGQPTKLSAEGPKAQRAEKQEIESVMRENEIGLFIAAADNGLFHLAINFAYGLRNRLQTFRMYKRVPLLTIIKTERTWVSPLTFMFAGLPAALAFIILDEGRKYAITNLYNLCTRRLVWPIRSRKRRLQVRKVMDSFEEILKAATFILIAPIELFATLQRLDLLPAWPPLPHPMSLIPFSASSPFQYPVLPAQFTLGSSMALVASFVLSPLPLYWILSQYREWIDRKAYSYLREVIPKPENPDSCSIKGAMEDKLDGETIPGLGSMKDYNEFENREPSTLLGEIKKDLRAVLHRLRAVTGLWTVRPEDEEDRPIAELGSPAVLIEYIEINPQASQESEAQARQTTSPSIHLPEPRPPFSTIDLNDNGLPAALSDPAAPDQPASPSSSLASAEAMIPEPGIGSTTVQVTTHAGSTDTLHMNVEIAGRVPGSAPIYTSSFSASPRPTAIETIIHRHRDAPPRHRVTALSAHLADSLRSRLSTHIADLLCLPLEADFLRSLTFAFLAAARPTAAAQATAVGLRAGVYPVDTWFGPGLRAGGWRGAGDYAGKMLLCMGLEAVVGFGVWECGAWITWCIGRRWFQWGRL